MNILDHIKEEHEDFKKKITKIEKAKGAKKEDMFKELYAEIHGHHEAEEKVLFPIVKEKAKGEDLEMVLEMIEEHSLGNYQFKVLQKTSVENETWDAKFTVLKEVLEHHMTEEEDELLPIAKKMISEAKLVESLDKFETVHKEKTKQQEKKLI